MTKVDQIIVQLRRDMEALRANMPKPKPLHFDGGISAEEMKQQILRIVAACGKPANL